MPRRGLKTLLLGVLLASTLLLLPNSAVPFELAVNCSLETG
mgnify:CR=1 FL=1